MEEPQDDLDVEELEDRRSESQKALRRVLDSVLEEMDYQRRRWGYERDRKHSPQDWVTIHVTYLGKLAYEVLSWPRSKQEVIKRLRQMSAISMSALFALTSERESTDTE